MSADENKALVERFINEVWNEGNLKVLDEVLAPDFVQHGPGPTVQHGRKAITEFRDFMQGGASHWGSFPTWILERLIAEGTYVVALLRGRPVARGKWPGGDVHPSKRDYVEELDEKPPLMVFIFRIANGKIAEEWETFDGPKITIGARIPRTEEEGLYYQLVGLYGGCGGLAMRLEMLAGAARTEQDLAQVAETKDAYLQKRDKARAIIKEIEERFGSSELLERMKASDWDWDRVGHFFERE